MPATLRWLLGKPALRLRPLCLDALLDRPIGWVHVSELADPTPYLEGGELLLTTGLSAAADGDFSGFVAQLVRCGVVGLGFGTGLNHTEVPPGLVRAAAHAELPLLEVPERTPFIAISKAVAAEQAADGIAAAKRTDKAQRDLTAAAMSRGGTSAVVRQLARLVNGWVLLLHGKDLVAGQPTTAARYLPALAADIERVRRHGSRPIGMTVTVEGHKVVLQPLRARGQGMLVVGRQATFALDDRQIIGCAISLVTLVHASSTVTRVQRDLRRVLLNMMICDAAGPGRKWAGEIWGPQPAAPLHVSVFRGRPPVLRRLVESLELDGSSRFPLFFAELRDEVVVLSAATDPRALAWLISLAGKGAYLGVSSPINDAAIGHGQRQARDAAETAHRSGVPAIRFEDLAGARLLDVVPQEAAEAFAVSLLKPVLDDDDKHPGRLIESLRVWLSHNGQCEPAAKRLGIHRHTLTQRMRTVEQLTQRSLDSPGFRAELWVALHALDKPH